MFGPENCPGLKETWGGKAKKEMKGGSDERKRERKWGGVLERRRRVEKVVVLSAVCVLRWGRKEGVGNGGVEGEREREGKKRETERGGEK